MARNSTEQPVAVWSRENPLFPTHHQHGQDMKSTSIYKCGVMLFLGGGVCCVFFLLPGYLSPRELLCFRSYGFKGGKKVSPNPRIALLSQRVLFFQGGLYPRTRAAAIRSKCLIGEAIIAYDRSTA